MSLYVHLPWCVRKCPYCDFNSHEPRGEIPEGAYVDAVLADLQQSLPDLEGRQFATVYFGGGTPSLFSPASVGRIIGAVQTAGHLAAGAEVTLEANPGTADADRFLGYRQAGVNRLSVGVQSFDGASLQALGRIHDGDEAHRAVEMAAGCFDNFNLDLMYGLPGQNLTAAEADARAAVASGAPHLSCYQLTLEPNTTFAKFPPALPVEDLQAEIESVVHGQLQAGGYQRYEVSAHGQPGRECQHNRHYWEFGDYLGVGAGAHSKLTLGGQICRQARVRTPQGYMRRSADGDAIAERRRVQDGELLLEFMMNALRLTDGFVLELLAWRTGLDPSVAEPALQRAADLGLLEIRGHHVQASARGQRYLNAAIREFLPD
ncbi:MAG: radical SAM family heme chaperone HemW [Gammaproteobacteria bacterium]